MRRVIGGTLWLALWMPLHALSLTVPGDYSSIQAALDASSTGDEVIVAAGTYQENLAFPGHDLVLRSEDPSNPVTVSTTIIDGGGKDTVIKLAGGETSACVIEGLTIANGFQISFTQGQQGGGIHAHGSQATIRRNIIRDNAARSGAGIAESEGLIIERITANRAHGRGGGLDSCSGSIIGNLIDGNMAGQQIPVLAPTESYGGGLGFCEGRIENNIIIRNISQAHSSNPSLKGVGGGIATVNAKIRNNVIAFNYAKDSGGGVSGSEPELTNNIIVENTLSSNSLSPDTAQVYLDPGLLVGVHYNLIQDWARDLENFSANPQFADAGHDDFRLLPDSPCIDAGGNVEGMTTDYDGNARPIVSKPWELRGDQSGFDIGPFEYQHAISFEPPGLLTLTESGDVWGVVRNPGNSIAPAPQRLEWLGYSHNTNPGDVTLAGDYTGDGIADFVTITWAGDFWVAENDGKGHLANRFLRAEESAFFSEPEDAPGKIVFFYDFNGDGLADLIALNSDGSVRKATSLGKTFGTFTVGGDPGFFWKPSEGLWVGIGDFDGDHGGDLVQIDSQSGQVSVSRILNSPSDWGTPGLKYDRSAGFGLHIGDVNADGRDDLIQVSPDGRLDVALSDGTRFLTSAFFGQFGFHDEPERGHGWNVFVADMNGDGRADLVQLTEHGDWWQSLSTGTSFESPQHLGWTGFQHQPTGPWQVWVGRWRR